MKYFLFLFLITTNLTYSDENNQLLLHKEAKNISDIKLNSLDYKTFHLLSSLNKKLYIINFWATWCTPCIKEIPDLINLKKKIGDDVEMVFISVDSKPSLTIPKFLDKNNIDFPNFFTDQKMEITTELDVKVMPTTIIVDQNLKEISRTIGYFNWSSSKVITQISDLF